MNESYHDRETSSKETKSKDQTKSDYEYNTEYGDGDIPEIDLPSPSNVTRDIPYEFPGKP